FLFAIELVFSNALNCSLPFFDALTVSRVMNGFVMSTSRTFIFQGMLGKVIDKCFTPGPTYLEATVSV
ncbi:hypothetical protein JGI8_02053, partial [Candidatus Kryptonium thompsonii]